MSRIETARVLPLLRRADPCPRILAVASGKGGVGKTWLSITLAHALARIGQRTLLFDGDLGLANVDIQLGLRPRADLTDVLGGGTSLKGAAERLANGGFDIIAGRSGSGALSAQRPETVGLLADSLTGLAQDYDRLLIDLAAGLDGCVRLLAGRADAVLVLTTEEPTALTDAYAFIKVLRAGAPEADIRIVVNMAETVQEGERTYQTLVRACEGFLRFAPRLAGIVRRDRQVPDAIRTQTMLLTRAPNSDAATDVIRLASRLMEPR